MPGLLFLFICSRTSPTKFCFHSVPFALSAHIVERVGNFSGSGAGFWRLTDLFVSTNTKPAKLGTSQSLFSIVYRYQVVSNTLHVCHLGGICSPRGLVDLFFKVACPNGVTRAHKHARTQARDNFLALAPPSTLHLLLRLLIFQTYMLSLFMTLKSFTATWAPPSHLLTAPKRLHTCRDRGMLQGR